MKRVVILSAFFRPLRSGAEACAEAIAEHLGKDYEMTILTAKMRRDVPTRDVFAGVPVVRLGVGHPVDKWLYPFLATFAACRFQPDLVHGILETFAGAALLLCRITCPRAKRLLTLQTVNRTFLKSMIVRSPDAVTAISTALWNTARDMGRKDVRMIPNGVPYAVIREACAKYPKMPGRILFVGRLEKMKGVDVLLRAFTKMINDQTPMTNVHLHIVGDGSETSKLKTQVSHLRQGFGGQATLGLDQQVAFLGFLSDKDLHRQYAEAEIFCGLSRSEALGNVFLEAQAAGCAVIATKVGGIPEIVRDGDTGILIPPDDAEAAAGAIARLLRDPFLRTRLAEAGVKNAEKYDWQKITAQYEQIYKSLLA